MGRCRGRSYVIDVNCLKVEGDFWVNEFTMPKAERQRYIRDIAVLIGDSVMKQISAKRTTSNTETAQMSSKRPQKVILSVNWLAGENPVAEEDKLISLYKAGLELSKACKKLLSLPDVTFECNANVSLRVVLEKSQSNRRTEASLMCGILEQKYTANLIAIESNILNYQFDEANDQKNNLIDDVVPCYVHFSKSDKVQDSEIFESINEASQNWTTETVHQSPTVTARLLYAF